MSSAAPIFALLAPEHSAYETSRVALLPVPFERTTSYGRGTAGGPAALIEASGALETWDDELRSEPFRLGIATLPELDPEATDLGEALAVIEEAARELLEAGKFLFTVGGEHSLTLAPVRAAKEVHGEIGVIQFDAHADLRDEYGGTPHSHACVMRRILDEGLRTLAVGIRSLSAPEAALIEELGLAVIPARELGRNPAAVRQAMVRTLNDLPRRIYITFDLDYFDPSLLPATGSPEPGGGEWYPTLELLRLIFETKEVVAMDLVELAPIPGQPASDFLAAKLVYKCLAYLQASGV